MKTFCPQQPVVVRDYNTEHILRQGEAYRSTRSFILSFLLPAWLLLSYLPAEAQYCNTNVPTFTVNLTGNPSGSWISPNVVRNDNCCGSTPPDVCVQFIVTLDPNSQGIIFNIYSGAMPTGALYYQVNCSPPTPVGQPICLVGVGPHYITFCKPGNNSNQYIITSIPNAGAGPATVVNDGCSDTIYALGYDESTVTWNSVYPGPPGFYNSYLTCQAGCDTTQVIGQPSAPQYIDYRVCGLPLGGCVTTPVCDTVRVYFNQALIASILPQNPTVCFGNPGTWITGSASGGAQPYSYVWSTGSTAQSIFVGPGTYTVTVSDTTGCPAATATVTVTSFSQPITANAGPNQSSCSANPVFSLNGSVTGASGGVWSGGSGTFSPSSTALNATYTPSPTEISAGSVTLILTTTGNGTCPGDADTITLFMNSFTAQISSSINHVLCAGGSGGSITLTLTGGTGPFSYSWNTVPAQSTSAATGLAAGNYSVVITDGNGCTGSSSFAVTEPAPLTLATAGFPAPCASACNGQATVIPSGGAGNFTYSWNPSGNTNASVTGLCGGIYTVTVTDQNGCSQIDTAIVTQPAPLQLTTSSAPATCFNSCNGTASANATGGNGPYSWSWNSVPVQSTQNATGLCAGTYTVTVTDANGCISTLMSTVTQPTALTLSVSPPTGTLCIGQSTTLSASASGGTAPYTFIWSSGSPTVSPSSTTTYTVYVTDASGCTSGTQTLTVNVHPPLSVSTQGTVNGCYGSASTLTASGTGGNGGPYTYTWMPGNMTGASVNVNPLSTTTYTVTFSDNCTSPAATATVTVNVMALPAVSMSIDKSSGCGSVCVQFTNTSPNAVSAAWNFGDNSVSNQMNPQHCYNSPGAYTVTLTITDANGCTNTLVNPAMISVYANPIASFTLGPQPTTILDPDICFTDHSTNDVITWYWNFDDPNDPSGSSDPNPCHTYSDTGTYCASLIVHNANGCWSTATQCLKIQPYYTLYVPNAFTPNGDGLNDIFTPEGSTLDENGFEMMIFDRWGKMIFKTTQWGKGWNGAVSGGTQPVQIGVYVWKINVRDYTGKLHNLAGHVSVVK